MRPRMQFVPATRRTRLAAILLFALLPLFPVLAIAAPQSVTGGVRFTYSDPAAGSVNWAGAFNNWSTSATPLVQGRDGIWSVDIALPAGTHEYKFVINGSQWIGDPENPMTSGSDQNSVVNVGADGKLVAAQAPSATPLKYNPKIGIGGRIRALYESIYNPGVTRYELTRPMFDVDLAFDIKMSDVLKAHWLMNINPEQENVQDYRSRLNFKRGSLLVSQPNLSLLAFDGEGIGTWDDPMHLVGNIGPFNHPYGYQRQGVKLGTQRYGFDTEFLYTDNFDDRLTSNSDLYQGYRIDNFPTFTFGPNQQSGITFEASDQAALAKAISLLQTVRTSPLSAPTPTFALVPVQGAKVMTQDIGDNGKLFGYGDNAENMSALRIKRGLPGHLSAGALGRVDRGFGFGRLEYAEPVGDSLISALSALYSQEWFGGGAELNWAPSERGRVYGEALAGQRRMNFVNGSLFNLTKVTKIDAMGATTGAAVATNADGKHFTLDKSLRLKLGGDWTMAQGDIAVRMSVERETHKVPYWTQEPVAPAGQPPVNHVRFRTVEFQRGQYFGPNSDLDNSATTLRFAWDRNWRYYLGREVKSSLDLEWTNFTYDKRTAWEHQFWFPSGNFWLESGQSRVGIDRMTVLGEQQAVRIRPVIDVPLLHSRDMRFTWRGTFSGVSLDKRPRYAESILQYGFDLNRTVRINSDTRWAKYNAPALSLGSGYVSTFNEALFRLAPGVQFSIGWGIDPSVLDPNTNEYATIGRDVFLNDRNVNGFIAETNNLSLGPQIAAAERALRNEKRIQIQAIVHF